MYESIIKRLRDKQKAHMPCGYELCGEAADAIEELARKEKFHAFLWNTIQPNEMETYLSMYNAGDEKEES